jgi:hypothetical protein
VLALPPPQQLLPLAHVPRHHRRGASSLSTCSEGAAACSPVGAPW